MTKGDIDFLRELQYELNTQENDGQAEPRFGVYVKRSRDTYEERYKEVCTITTKQQEYDRRKDFLEDRQR